MNNNIPSTVEFNGSVFHLNMENSNNGLLVFVQPINFDLEIPESSIVVRMTEDNRAQVIVWNQIDPRMGCGVESIITIVMVDTFATIID